MEANCRELLQSEYSCLAKKVDHTEPTDAFEAWRNSIRDSDGLTGDEFTRFCPKGAGIAAIGPEAVNPIQWWDLLGRHLPSMRQWAFDTLACPATSCECERAFSSGKRLITADQNALDDLIEALRPRVSEVVVGLRAGSACLKEAQLYYKTLLYSRIYPISASIRPITRFGRCYTR
jgi:hypothetical protein